MHGYFNQCDEDKICSADTPLELSYIAQTTAAKVQAHNTGLSMKGFFFVVVFQYQKYIGL